MTAIYDKEKEILIDSMLKLIQFINFYLFYFFNSKLLKKKKTKCYNLTNSHIHDNAHH